MWLLSFGCGLGKLVVVGTSLFAVDNVVFAARSTSVYG